MQIPGAKHLGSEDLLHIEITDTGGGISKEKISRICTPFYTTKENGTGLGLYIVKRSLDAHKATIELFSSIDNGTAFTITFPKASESSKQDPAA